MTKQYPSKQYLSEVISNREFAESVPPEIVIVMARQLLASMEQEPVYQVLGDGGWTDYSKQQLEDLLESKPSTLFRVAYPSPSLTQPVPVDEDDNFYSWFGREWHENYQHNQYTTAVKQMLGVMAESAWRASRSAAMLQGAEPVSQPYTLPEGMVIVPVEPTREMRLQIHPIAEATCMECGRSVTADCEDNVLLSWADMIAAAPQQEADNG